jgi:PAS domain S-box-containing protein
MNMAISAVTPDFLQGGGEMGELTRRFDWGATTLGPPEVWPQSLRLAVRLLLTSQHPMFIWWGPDLIQFYNDAYRLTMGPERHPRALGQPGRACWEEIWDIIGPQIELVLSGRGATWREDQLVPVTRHGRREDVWWTYGYSPIHDDQAANGVGGVLVVCNDVTDRHRIVEALQASEQRLKLALDASQLVGIWDWDVAADRITGDARFARLHGLDPGRVETGLTRAEAHVRLHPDDRARLGETLDDAIANGRPPGLRGTPRRADGGVRWAEAHGVQMIDPEGRQHYLGATVDVTAGRAAEERLRSLFEQAPGFVAVMRGPDHVFELHNQAYSDLLGGRDLAGQSVRDAMPELAGQGFLERLDQVYVSGEPFVARGAEIMLQRSAEGLERRFLDFVYQPIRDADGAVSGILAQGHDITEQRKAEEHRQLLVNELNHRVKNTLSTIQAVAQQTMRDNVPMKQARDAFVDRLIAMSRNHDLLTMTNWEGADLSDVVDQALSAHVPPDRRRVAGPSLQLEPRVALALGMALHELATNAAKYGALSIAAGQVEVLWSVDPDDRGGRRLALQWREHGGPPVAPPGRKGFGSRLIERGLSQELNGEARLIYEPTGVVCLITAPV